MISKLHRECGSFTVIQHPVTGNAWPVEVFVKTFLLVLAEFEDQLDALFVVGPMDKLLFKDDSTKKFFVETAKSHHISLTPKKNCDGIDWTGVSMFNLTHYHLQIRADRLRKERARVQKEELARALVLVLNYHNKTTNTYTWVHALGQETGGQYAGQFNLCSGKLEQADGGCFLRGAIRELAEEFKIQTSFGDGTFDAMFKGSNGKIRWIMHHRTPIFIGVLPAGFSRKPIKQAMAADVGNLHLPHSQREMSDFEFVRLDNGLCVDGRVLQVSTYAEAVRQKIDVTAL